MINGTTEIIAGVPANIIDPLLLPDCHGAQVFGYIVISHPDHPETFDILFLKGKQITQCASINGDLHFLSSVDIIKGRLHGGELVHLFHSSREQIEMFSRTFHLLPRIKVRINGLTQKQVSELLKSTSCVKGILEVGSYTPPLPAIVLHRFSSGEELMELGAGLKKGLMLLYDTEMNPTPAVRRKVSDAMNESTTLPEKLKGVRERVDQALTHEVTKGESSQASPQPSDTKQELHGVSPELVRLLERTLRSFRLQMFEILGRKMEARMKSAEKELRLLAPEFDAGELRPSTALQVLDLISSVIRQAPVLKRSKLRSIALVLIGDLYNKNLEMLEQCDAVAPVEQCYYRLKG